MDQTKSSNGSIRTADPFKGTPIRPDGPGMYLYWDGKKSYRTRMPAPRVLEPVLDLSYGDHSGNVIIEGDNLQAMVSLRSQYLASVDIAYMDPPSIDVWTNSAQAQIGVTKLSVAC